MSHFEYVSVATALMYALLAGRLLSGLSPSLDKTRRYPIQIAWIVVLMLVCAMQWWLFWTLNQVIWTPIRFLYALAMPGLIFVRAGILLGGDPSEVVSFHDHFHESRLQFFALGVVASAQAGLAPWVFGIWPWFTSAPIHPTTLVLATLSIAGLLFKSQRAHAVIVSLSFLLVVATFYVVPSVSPSA